MTRRRQHPPHEHRLVHHSGLKRLFDANKVPLHLATVIIQPGTSAAARIFLPIY